MLSSLFLLIIIIRLLSCNNDQVKLPLFTYPSSMIGCVPIQRFKLLSHRFATQHTSSSSSQICALCILPGACAPLIMVCKFAKGNCVLQALVHDQPPSLGGVPTAEAGVLCLQGQEADVALQVSYLRGHSISEKLAQ